jgi:hypothetical protein
MQNADKTSCIQLIDNQTTLGDGHIMSLLHHKNESVYKNT